MAVMMDSWSHRHDTRGRSLKSAENLPQKGQTQSRESRIDVPRQASSVG